MLKTINLFISFLDSYNLNTKTENLVSTESAKKSFS